MKASDFKIGQEFKAETGTWRVTDVGSRVIVAIHLKPDLAQDWFFGPTYAVPEVVFDEDDMDAIEALNDRGLV